MKKESIHNQLNRRKIFVVRYAFLINLFITIAIICLLLFFRIGNNSILSLATKYYLNKN